MIKLEQLKTAFTPPVQFMYSEHSGVATATIMNGEELLFVWETEVFNDEEREEFIDEIIEDLRDTKETLSALAGFFLTIREDQ